MFTVVTSRFNSETLVSNYEYRSRHNFNCIYCCPSKLSPKIPYDTLVFVIEMNNSTNMIEGIGLIKNKPEIEKYYKVHLDGNTNRYIYIGKYFINRKMIEDYNPQMVQILDQILFKGKTHSKRGAGLTTIPEKVLKLDICKGVNIKKDIKDIFINTFSSDNIEDNNLI